MMQDTITHDDFGTDIASDSVRFERLLPGPIERVWTYLTDTEKRGLWLASGPMEPRVGGKAELQFRNRDLTSDPVPERFRQHAGDHLSRHTILRYEPPTALAMTWGEGETQSEVSFDLSTVGDRVRLVVTHVRLTEAGRSSVSGGWHVHLSVLAARLEDRPLPPFWATLAEVNDAYAARRAKAKG